MIVFSLLTLIIFFISITSFKVEIYLLLPMSPPYPVTICLTDTPSAPIAVSPAMKPPTAQLTDSLIFRLSVGLCGRNRFWPFGRTVGQNKQEYRLKYWATCSSIHSFGCTAHSFACSALLAYLARSTALTRLLARSLRSLSCSWESEFLMSQNNLVLSWSSRVKTL